MTTDLLVRGLRSDDVERVGELVRASFEADLTAYMVATQSGWTDFLRVLLAQPTSFPTHRLTVAERDGAVVAFADYRVPEPEQGFLSYICVDAAARGGGVGRRLFAEVIRRQGPVRCVGLDVFADNEAALGLYGSMGFRETARQVWWRAPVPSGSTPIALHGLPASLASLERYGFCELAGEHEGRRFRLGRMGGAVLRAFSGDDYDDVRLLARLAETFPELREVFVVLPDGVTPRLAGAEPFNIAIRMSADDLRL